MELNLRELLIGQKIVTKKSREILTVNRIDLDGHGNYRIRGIDRNGQERWTTVQTDSISIDF